MKMIRWKNVVFKDLNSWHANLFGFHAHNNSVAAMAEHKRQQIVKIIGK